MRNDEKMYDLIKTIAEEQKRENDPIKRDDLAYILCKKLGLDSIDGVELERLVYEAYQKFGMADVIRNMIVSNDGASSVVDEANMKSLGKDGISSALLSIVAKDLKETEARLIESANSLKSEFIVELTEEAASVYKWLQGTNGIEELRSKGSALMTHYEGMVQDYYEAENGVKRDIHDFVELRSCVNSIFMQNACTLVDIFGDSVKVVAPELFDFDSVKWLDVSAMQKTAKLEYNKLDSKCTLLLGEISESFNKMLDGASSSTVALKKLGGKGGVGKAGIYSLLAVQLVKCLNHVLDSNAKKTQLTEQYVRFEDSVKRDKLKVSADLKRLGIIHKTLNDHYIPQADAFARLSNGVLSDDFEQLLREIYSGDDVQELKKERDALLARCKELEESINDHQENIALFDYQIEDWKNMIDTQKGQYQKAKKEKPSKPNAIMKLLTFGYTQRKYEENITDWSDLYGAFVTEYENAMLDVTEATENRKSHDELLEKNKKEYDFSIKRLKELNKKMADRIQCSPELRLRVAKHLKDIVSLLHAAKQVMQLGLNENLTGTTTLAKEQNALLPTDVQQRVLNFTDSLSQQVRQNSGSIADAVVEDLSKDFQTDATMKAELVAAVDKTATLFDSWTRLQAMKLQAKLNNDVYVSEMARLKDEFQKEISLLDKKSEVIQEALRRANLAVDKEDLRKALIDLAGGSASDWNDADFDAFLSGTKVLEI